MKKLKLFIIVMLSIMLMPISKVQAVDNCDISYQTHVQTYGWQEKKYNGDLAGTTGQSKRLEGISLFLENSSYSGSIQYRTHVQTYGWENEWKSDGQMSGTSGQAKRLEAIQIKLTGDIENYYDVYYRVHAQHFGWLDWAKNGESAGTAGYSYRLEAIQIQLVPKNQGNLNTAVPFKGYLSYQTHVQTYGWQEKRHEGDISGTTGKSKRLEGICISLGSNDYSGSIQYRTHIQTYGWENGWKSDGQMSGTSGQSKRLEAIQIQLTGEMANHYDVYYRVHAQHFGWLGWAKNGESAGTAGYAYRLEGIQIVLVKKGGSAPGSTTHCFYQFNSWVSNLKVAQKTSQLIVVSTYNTNYATVSMHTKKADGTWSDDYSITGRIGKNGVGKTSEGDKKTPTGVYTLGQAFGVGNNPGSTRNYLKVNNNHYWVDDSQSRYYNQLVDVQQTGKQWKSAEHLISYPKAYKYAIAVNFNTEHTPNKGSAIFLHCYTGSATPGCIAIDEGYMVYTLRNLKADTYIVIDNSRNIQNY